MHICMSNDVTFNVLLFHFIFIVHIFKQVKLDFQERMNKKNNLIQLNDQKTAFIL